jgi:uncharacterized protein
MISPENVAVGIVALIGGKLVGRKRLQKTAFLLERLDMGSGLEFDYLYYGPFSADLARGWDDAQFDGRLQLEEIPGRGGTFYTVFTTREAVPDRLGNLSASEVQARLASMARYSDIVLEVAATIVYLRGFSKNPIEEVKILKPHKATDQRIAQATELINELGL